MSTQGVAQGETRGVVIADDPLFVNWLSNGIGPSAEFSLVKSSDAEDMLDKLAAMGRMDVAFFEFGVDNTTSRAAMVEAFVERYPDVPVVGLGGDGAQDVVFAAMRAGARDFFVLQRDDDHLPQLLARVLRRAPSGSRQKNGNEQGRVFTVFSAVSSDQTAFCAEHLALDFLARSGSDGRGLLIDLSTPPGAAAVFLNLHPAYTLLDAMQDVYRCDQTLVDTAFSRHKSGLFLLSLPEEQIGYPTLDADELVKLVDVLRALFPFVVVALDSTAPLHALSGLVALSEKAVLLSDQSILKSRHAKHLLRELRLHECPLEHAGLVVDGFQKRLGLDTGDLADLLELPLLGTLPPQSEAATHARNQGEPLADVAARDPWLRDLQQLAEQLWGGEGAPEADKRGGLARFFRRS